MYGTRRIFSKDGGFNHVDGDRLLKGYRRDGLDEVEFRDYTTPAAAANQNRKFNFGGIGADSSTESYSQSNNQNKEPV